MQNSTFFFTSVEGLRVRLKSKNSLENTTKKLTREHFINRQKHEIALRHDALYFCEGAPAPPI